MYQGRRYNGSVRGYAKGPNVFLRIVISLAVAVILSVVIILIGASLGEKAPDGEPEPETTAAQTTETAPSFNFKSIEAKTLAQISAMPLFDEDKPKITVLNVSNEDGKLNCITSVNSLIYGNAVSSELRPIEALLYEAKNAAEAVSVRFVPFKDKNEGGSASLFSIAVVGALSEYDIEEIVISLDGVSPSDAARMREAAKGRIKVGGAVSVEMLSDESLLKEYYTALDFLVLDATALDITEYAEESGGALISSEEPKSVESVLEEYGLLIVKYSIRMRVTCHDKYALDAFLALYESFELCGYEIDAPKK